MVQSAHKKLESFSFCAKKERVAFVFIFFVFKFMQKSFLSFLDLKKTTRNPTKKFKREGEQSHCETTSLATLRWLKRFQNEIIGIIECTQIHSSHMMLE